MTRQTDNVYRLDHGVTKKQKRILQAFSVDVPLVTYWAKEISKELKEVSKKAKKAKKGAGEECEKERKRNIGHVGPTSNHQQGCWFVTNFRCF